MQIVKKAVFEEVLNCFQQENRKSEINCGTESFDWTTNRLGQAWQQFPGQWTLLLLSKPDIVDIMLPVHRHEVELIPESGLSVSATVEKLRHFNKELIPKCWANICSHKERDFSQTHVFMEYVGGHLCHLDGVHRLLAYMLFDKNQEVPAYIAGF